MAKLTEEMKDFIKGKMGYIATATPNGVPNIGPKGSFRVIDDEHVGWNEMTCKNTYAYLQRNPKVAVAVVDRESRQGFRFVGTAELLTAGPLYEKNKEEMVAAGRRVPQALVCVSVEEIYNIGWPNWQKLA